MLEQILKDSAYKLTQFKSNEVAAVEEKIYQKSNGKFYMKCLIRDKEILLKPEEVIRQLFIYKLIHTYGYEKSEIKVEYNISFGRETKRADIVIVNSEYPDSAYIVVEVKRPNVDSGQEQLKSYCHASGAPIAVWTNGEKMAYWTRQEPNIFIPLSDIPYANQTLEDMQTKHWYFEDLKEYDILSKGTLTLSRLIKELEDDILANAGVDSFEEVFKLIFTKLYDEKLSANDKKRYLEFRNYNIYKKGENKEETTGNNKKLSRVIQDLFKSAKEKWEGVFAQEDLIELTPSHLAICISKLQNVKLFNSNLEVIDEAFEYLMSKSQKGEKGQYFTPRYVIDMCVKMLNPKDDEYMIDTAAGSCGFPVHTMFHVWKNICKKNDLPEDDLFTAENKPEKCIAYVQKYIFAIDFDEKAVRVARTLNLIAGDGKTNVIRLNTLDYKRWGEVVNDNKWLKKYSQGWFKLYDLRASEDEDDFQNFKFDVLMANPPFAGDVKEKEIIQNYQIAEKSPSKNKKDEKKYQDKMSRDVLFIERNLQFLKPGGRMAIILPQGRFNNSSDKYIRDFIAERCRILAVVGLHGNVFKPHTGTKTSVLFVQKWDDELCPYCEDYKIFFATMQKPSKDNSGDKIYCTTAEGLLRDKHNHLIVDHDLFAVKFKDAFGNDVKTDNGIAEAFIEFAKREKLSFFDSGSFNELHYNRLLEELECTEIFLSEIKSGLFRLEAEFYQKKYLELEKKLSDNLELGQFAKKIECGPFGSNLLDTEYLPDGVLVVRPFNLKNLVVENDNLVYISEKLIQENNLKIYKRNTLLFSRVGDIKIGILNRNAATISPNIIAVELKNSNLAKFFAVFFNTYVGFTQIARQLKVSAQPTISTDIIKNLKVFVNDKIVSAVIEIFDSAQNKLNQADETYRAAENILAQALHLQDFKPSSKNTAEINFSASFGKTGRLDAEYYQPKYDDAKNFMNIAGTVEKLCNVYEQNFLPKSEEIYKYIELANVGTNGNISTPDKIIGAALPTRARQKVKAGQVIISSVEGSLQSCAIITAENDGAICSTGFFVVDSENYNPATLLILFKSEIMQLLMKQGCSGTILTAISRANFLNLPLPKIDAATQEKISSLVEKSFELREESKRMLEVAKLAAEMAIERGENAATEYLRRGENFGD